MAASIILHNINFQLASTPPSNALSDLSLSFAKDKTAIIGRNGIGKSILLKLIAGELTPESGEITRSGEFNYLSQDVSFGNALTVVDALGVADKLAALQRISDGSTDEADYTIIGDDWDITDRINRLLATFDLKTVTYDRRLDSLSGGERTRLALAACFAKQPDFIILDEPTNNLDQSSCEQLYRAIQEWSAGLIIVSHERALLRLMDRIIELTTHGATIYGGNYDFYLEEKTKQQAALEHQYLDAQKRIKQTKREIQSTKEKQQKRAKMGKQLRKTKSQAKVVLDAAKERATRTEGALATSAGRQLLTAQKQLAGIKSKLEVIEPFDVDLAATKIHSHKKILEIDNIGFSYANSNVTLIQNFSLSIIGPERVALVGDNGSGKTTLVKLIMGELQPTAGEIILGANFYCYLEQTANGLSREDSILDNFKRFNPDISEHDAYHILSQFNFRGEQSKRLVEQLSGGERLRVLLACELIAKEPPQLLILDEPTNHLDLESIQSVETALQAYQGAILVISHDTDFLHNIGITKFISTAQ